MQKHKIFLLVGLIVLVAAGCNKVNPLSNGSSNNSGHVVNESENSSARKTYTNDKYKFAVDYPSGYMPSERQPSPQDTTFSVDFMPLDQNGNSTDLDYGNPSLFSIIVWPKTSIKQIVNDSFKNVKNYESKTVNINGNNFTIVTYTRPSIPGAKDDYMIKEALIALGSGSLTIENGQSNIEEIINDYNFHFIK